MAMRMPRYIQKVALFGPDTRDGHVDDDHGEIVLVRAAFTAFTAVKVGTQQTKMSHIQGAKVQEQMRNVVIKATLRSIQILNDAFSAGRSISSFTPEERAMWDSLDPKDPVHLAAKVSKW
jgi:hypothetical protein